MSAAESRGPQETDLTARKFRPRSAWARLHVGRRSPEAACVSTSRDSRSPRPRRTLTLGLRFAHEVVLSLVSGA